MQKKTLNFEEMATIEGGMPCWLAVGLALGVSAAAGAECGATLGTGCAFGVMGMAYSYDTAVAACK
jgi:bacteriocin-like protein